MSAAVSVESFPDLAESDRVAARVEADRAQHSRWQRIAALERAQQASEAALRSAACALAQLSLAKELGAPFDPYAGEQLHVVADAATRAVGPIIIAVERAKLGDYLEAEARTWSAGGGK